MGKEREQRMPPKKSGRRRGMEHKLPPFGLPQGPIDPELWANTKATPTPGAAARFDDEKDRS